MKINSLVPGDATDIRDVPWHAHSEVEARRFRAMLALIAASFFVLVAFVLAIAFLRFSRNRKRREQGEEPKRTVAPHALVRMLLSAARELQQSGRTHENHEYAGRVLTIARVSGALVFHTPYSLTELKSQGKGLEGQVRLKELGLAKHGRFAVHADLTPEELARLVKRQAADRPPSDQSLISEFIDVFTALNALRYEEAAVDTAEIDAALKRCIAILEMLRRDSSFFARLAAKFGSKQKRSEGS
jgi:hypothetical protein